MSARERGFHYFDSPENKDDDVEVISYLFLYCCEAVRLWPEFRKRLVASGEKSAKQCDDIQTYAIDIFREMRDAIFEAIETGKMWLISKPLLGDRLAHAFAMLALYADPAALPAYRDMILSKMGEPSGKYQTTLADFEAALWGREWSSPGDRMPSEITYREALRNRQLHELDGKYNTGSRLDVVAKARPLQVGHPEEKLPEPFSEKQVVTLRRKLRGLGVHAGLKPPQADFLVAMAFGKKQQKDNPTAWRAIKRKSALLRAGITDLLAEFRASQENSFYSGMSNLRELLS